MSKKISEMSLEELWKLFPIILMEHNPVWSKWYQEEEQLISQILPMEQVVQMNHIGSTAIEGIWAKPIIDILIEVNPDFEMEQIKDILCQTGYRCMSQSENRISLNKGYTENGFEEKVFHLHLRYSGDHDELYFRDYLRAHVDVAKEYEELKLGLWKKFEHNRDGYTDAKTEFVKKYTQMAKEESREYK